MVGKEVLNCLESGELIVSVMPIPTYPIFTVQKMTKM